MKNHIISALLAIATLICIGCNKEAVSTETKGEFKIEFLFEHEGCKVYRFNDGGHYIYYSDCRGQIHSEYTTRSGKRHHTQQVQSLNN